VEIKCQLDATEVFIADLNDGKHANCFDVVVCVLNYGPYGKRFVSVLNLSVKTDEQLDTNILRPKFDVILTVLRR